MTTLTNIYELFKNSVEFYNGANRPNTFAVLQEKIDWSTENLGKTIEDKDLPYFYSRLWQNKGYNPSDIAFNFPLVSLIEIDAEYIEDRHIKYNFQLAVLDKLDINCKTSRKPQQIEAYTEQIIQNIFSYFKEVFEVDGVLYNKGHYLSLGLLNGASKKINIDLKNLYRVDGQSNNNLYGTAVTFSIKLPVCSSNIEFIFDNNNKSIADAGCC